MPAESAPRSSPAFWIPLVYSSDLRQEALEGGQPGLRMRAFAKVIGDPPQIQS